MVGTCVASVSLPQARRTQVPVALRAIHRRKSPAVRLCGSHQVSRVDRCFPHPQWVPYVGQRLEPASVVSKLA